MKLKQILLFLMIVGFCPTLSAQDKKPARDSTQVYKKIADYSKKSKFTKVLHRWLFRPATQKNNPDPVEQESKNHAAFEGKIIRNIIIETKDPFGFSFTDSTEVANSWLEKTGNKIHIKSKRMAIRNFLLLKENTSLDTLLMTETARLLREQNYIREVEIVPHFVSQSQDSVDIIITALDSWSLIPKAQLSGSQTKLSLKERNFIGTGHQFKFRFAKRLEDGKDAYEAIYMLPNFKNTFIGATGRYATDYDGYYKKTIAVDRIFYSPLTRWAGGLFLGERFLGRSLPNGAVDVVGNDIKYIVQDYWAGRSFRIFNGNTERERTTKLIVSARALLVDYKKTPPVRYDGIRFFSDEKFYMGSIGVASRQFIEDRYIFKDGITEDVPVGIIYSITGGVQHKNQVNRLYMGARASYGNYFNWGFLSMDFEAGSFLKDSKTEQTAYSFQANYFSNLIQLGSRWKMRQFIKPQFVVGINRLKSVADRLSLNENPDFNGVYGNLYFNSRKGNIPGFDSRAIGTSKYVLALQTQFYSPWEVLGFRFNPFVNITAGMLSDGKRSSGNSPIYSSFGVGCIIRNDYLVFSSFQFSVAYYPKIPGQGNNIFKTNAFENDDFGFQDFQIGKPRTVIYN